MGKTNRDRGRLPDSRSNSGENGPPWVLLLGLLVVVSVVAVFLYPRFSTKAVVPGETSASVVEETETTEHPIVPTREASPAHPGNVPLPSLPLATGMLPRPPEVIRSAYEFAALNPNILEYVPCFCGCESAGHTGNADCFVKSRNPDGSVAEWEEHGQACLVCVDVARDAMQLHASGGSVRDIRDSVLAKYGPQSPRQTPTPEPPTSE